MNTKKTIQGWISDGKTTSKSICYRLTNKRHCCN